MAQSHLISWPYSSTSHNLRNGGGQKKPEVASRPKAINLQNEPCMPLAGYKKSNKIDNDRLREICLHILIFSHDVEYINFNIPNSLAYIFAQPCKKGEIHKTKYRAGLTITLFPTFNSHQNNSCVLVHWPHTKTELLFWLQKEVGNNMNGHPVPACCFSRIGRPVQNGHEILHLFHRLNFPNPWGTDRGRCRILILGSKDIDETEDEAGCEVGPQ